MTLTHDNAASIDLYVWEGSSDFASRVDQALSGFDVRVIHVVGPDVLLPERDPARMMLALVSVTMVGDANFAGQEWLSAQAVPVIWVAAETRGYDPRYYPPAYSHTLPASFTSAELRSLLGRVLRLVSAPKHLAPACRAPFVAVSEVMASLLAEVDLFADSRSNVIVFGETGVGKEHIAQRLHDSSPARKGPFVAVNCGAVPEGLFEAHFFGHAKGAFTGASGAHKGYFEQADGGTLFLDEIGDLPLYQQVKLLRVLESSAVTRLGSTQEIAINFRLVAATNKNLAELVSRGEFRVDLYYRIAVIELWVPNLDERGLSEKKALFRALLARHWQAADDGSVREEPPQWLLDRVGAASYPGNVRELSNIAERIGLVRRQLGVWDEVRIERIFARLRVASPAPGGTLASAVQEMAPLSAAEQGARARILAALQANGWRRQDTAQQLGISRKVLWEKMRKLQLNPVQFEEADGPIVTNS